MESEFTGKRRYRVEKRLFKKPVCILQLEVKGFVPQYGAPSIDGEIKTWWIDALPQHITVENTND